MTNLISRLFGKRAESAPTRDVEALAADLSTPAIHVVKTLEHSRSHFGGCPNLPADIPWPEHQGAKLGFLARLSLPEIQQALRLDWLPEAGALLFFYDSEQQAWGFDPKDKGAFAVLHVLDIGNDVPQDTPALGPTLPHRPILFRRIDVLPSFERSQLAKLALSNDEAGLFDDLAEARFQGQPKHQVAGHPAPIQNDDMELEAQLVSHGIYCGNASGYQSPEAASLAPGAANWRLLFQFDTDDDLDVMWGDVGTIYFWVEEQKARHGNFDDAWMIFQCC